MILFIFGLVIWILYRSNQNTAERQAAYGGTRGPVIALIAWPVGVLLMLVWGLQLRRGDLLALPKLVGGLLVLLPWLTLRLIVMPLGLVRTAYYFSFLCMLRFEQDRQGGALLLAAWTLLRRSTRHGSDAAALRFVETRRERLKNAGSSVVALGLDLARRGEHDTARTVLRGLLGADSVPCPPFTYGLAREWMAVDAVARGAWSEVAVLLSRKAPSFPLTRFLGSCAARFVPVPDAPTDLPGPGQPLPAPYVGHLRPPHPATLVWRWLRAPYHLATWPLLQRALRSQPVAPPEPPPLEAAPPAPSDPALTLHAAMAELVALLQLPRRRLPLYELVRVCRIWDTTLASPEAHLQVAKRTLRLGQGTPETALDELRAQVAELMATLLRDARLPIGWLLGATVTAIGTTAAQAVRAELLEGLEQSCRALHDRTIDKRPLPIADEWREWAALLDRYYQVGIFGGLSVRRLAWGPFYHEACNWAVWLWNERREKILANTVFKFLLYEAEALKDEGRLPLARKNAGAGT